jgi:hypothetical protein
MKSLILSLLMSVLFLSGFAQSAENDCVKGQVIGITPDGKVIVEMTNKESCNGDVGYDIGTADIANKSIAAGASDTFEVTISGPTTILLENNTECNGSCGPSIHLPLLISIVNTPVTGLETFSAKWNEDSAKIFLEWTTYTEVDNKEFRVLNHGNPVPLGVVPTKALNGNSALPLTYRASIDPKNYDAFEILGMALSWNALGLLLFVSLVWAIIARKRAATILILAVGLAFMGCKKDKQTEFHGEYTLQLQQVDNSGTYDYSPERKVVF